MSASADLSVIPRDSYPNSLIYIINALVITGGIEVLPDYFREFVIGGKDAFVEVTSDLDGFERAMRRKLLREIGNLYLF